MGSIGPRSLPSVDVTTFVPAISPSSAEAFVPRPLFEPEAGHITAYRVSANVPEIATASPRREWMDQTTNRFAYRCLPLVIANQLGWDLLNPVAFRTRWLGGASPADVQVQAIGSGESDQKINAIGLFGHGILTFHVGSLFRTPLRVDLLATGPLNCPKDGIYPLSGVIETDWTSATFTMNYQFTRPGQWIEFESGEPFCRIIPLSLDLLERMKPELAEIDDDPDLANNYRQWSASRSEFNHKLDNPWSAEADRGWQKDYFRGRQVSGSPADRHRTQLHLREFGDGPPTSSAAAKQVAHPRIERRGAEDYLWHETDLFYSRRHKSAQVLVGLAKTLRRAQPLAGREESFLHSFERLLEMDPAIFSEIWQEPRAYFWTRMAFQLADAHLNGAALTPLAKNYFDELGATDIAEGLRQHLEQFREFELAAAVLANEEWGDETPLEVELPWAIPATDWRIMGEGPCEIIAYWNGQLHLRRNGVDQTVALTNCSEPLARSPIVEHAGCRLRIQPESLSGLGIPAVHAVLAEGDAFGRRHTELLRGALAAIEHYVPEMFEQISGTIRIVGLKSSAGDFTNVSFSELPGAMLLSVVDHPLVMADRIIHEFHHHRLFHIEDSGSLFASDCPAGEDFYSPWRADRRPLKGVLHGLYVYIAVGRYWMQVYSDGGLSDADYSLATDQLLRIAMQVQLARDELAHHARFTPPGEGLFARIGVDVDGLIAQIAALDLRTDSPAVEVRDDGNVVPQRSRTSREPLTVAEAIEEHRMAFAQANS